MKTIKYFALIFASALLFTNCDIVWDKWEEVDLSTIPDVLTFTGRGKCSTDNSLPNSFDYDNYTTVCEYKTNQNWCSSDGYTVSVEMNKTGSPRTATISVIFKGETIKTITVEQAALDYVVIGDLCIQKTDISNDVLTSSVAYSLLQSSRVEDFTDWRLPTMDELRVMYENRATIGGFKTTLQNGNKHPFYWPSESSYYYSNYIKDFYNGDEIYISADSQVGEGADQYNVYARLVRTAQPDDAN